MLITLYSNDLSNNFTVDFKDNIILPKYTTIRMTNALLTLAHNFVIDQDKQIKIIYNNKDQPPNVFVINAGQYTLAELAQHIELRINQNFTNNGPSNAKATMTYDVSKGFGAGCFDLEIEMTSLDVNIFQISDWGSANWSSDLTVYKDDSTLDTATTEFNSDGTNNFGGVIGLSHDGTLLDSWGYLVAHQTLLIKNWLEPTESVKLTNQAPAPVKDQPYGCLSWKDNGNESSYYVALNKTDPDFPNLGISNNDYLQITNLAGSPVMVLYTKSDSTDVDQYPYNSLTIFETIDGGTMEEVAQLEGFTGDEYVAVSFANGHFPTYYYKDDVGDDWIEIDLSSATASDRYTYVNTDNLKFGFSSFSKSATTADADLQISEIFSSGKSSTDTNTENWGQYLKLDWNNTNNNGFGIQLGFEENTYESDTSGTSPAKLAQLSLKNEDTVSVLGDASGAKYAPYINVNIDNLPIVSYGCNSTDDTLIGMNKCIASIPRYDFQGNFELAYNLVYNPVEPNTIRLNNAEEISISNLQMRLQQADGSYAVDIEAPKSFVLDVQSEENLHFRM